MNEIIKDFKEAIEILDAFVHNENNLKAVDEAAEMMATALRNGKKILSCGNGGSLCDAVHFAEELTGRFQKSRRPLPAIALSDAAHITCVANDFGFDFIYSRYVESVGNEGDVLLAISTSGNSRNIVNAIHSAKEKGMKVVALTGKSGGKISALCDVEIRAPHSEYSDRVQEIHIKVIHSLVHAIEVAIFPELIETTKN